MPTGTSKPSANHKEATFAEVSKEKVIESILRFKQRVEKERASEASRYSFPSDKTRIRVLE
jgi:hypothetical protein